MYLDPGFGGMLIQLALAIAATAGALLFAMRKKISEFFSRDKKVSHSSKVPAQPLRSTDDVIDVL